MSSNILFLTLRTFSATGGIEKVCRILGKALYEKSVTEGGRSEVCSMYDRQEDAENNVYFPAESFTGFAVAKISFIRSMVSRGTKNDVVILSHINLLVVGWMIKKISPKTRIILLAHGIEIWDGLSSRRKKMLLCCDQILAVSSYTRHRVIDMHGIDPEKCIVLNNCLDPNLAVQTVFGKSERLLEKYGFMKKDTILMTLTRLSSKERYKGYDKVIEAIANIIDDHKNVKYLIAGSYDSGEKIFLHQLISKLGLEGNIVLAGYIEDDELEAHFALSDIYIMPSRKEGFGIVFIEAMYYGLPVIAGNEDGSSDALLNGRLGQLVDPQSVSEITDAILNVFDKPPFTTENTNLMMAHFGYEGYKERLNNLLDNSNCKPNNQLNKE